MTTAADHPVDELHDHDRGLRFDLPNILTRRRMLAVAAGAASLAALAACGSDGQSSSNTAASTTTTASTTTEQASGRPGTRPESGIVRADIRSSFGSSATPPKACR